MILEVQGLTKTFRQGERQVHALNDVSFSVSISTVPYHTKEVLLEI